AGVAPGERLRLLDRRSLIELAVELAECLGVADRAPGGRAEAGRAKRRYLVDQPRPPHPLDALVEPGNETLALETESDGHGRPPGAGLLRQPGAEGLPGELDDLERPHDAPTVVRSDRLGGLRVTL